MAKRRTAGVQRRQRASSQALSRRIDARGGGSPLDWRLLAIGAAMVVAVVIVVVALVASSGPNPNAGTQFAEAGRTHVEDGIDVRATQPGAYNSTPATSGNHWGTPANWGVATTPMIESQIVHNLEHGGIVIWYQPDQVSEEGVAAMADLVNDQLATGIGGRFKFILSPWAGEDFGHPIAVTSWQWLLYLDEPNVDAIRGFADAHYGQAPEPQGGPGL
jgi:hypothetical protein